VTTPNPHPSQLCSHPKAYGHDANHCFTFHPELYQGQSLTGSAKKFLGSKGLKGKKCGQYKIAHQVSSKPTQCHGGMVCMFRGIGDEYNIQTQMKPIASMLDDFSIQGFDLGFFYGVGFSWALGLDEIESNITNHHVSKSIGDKTLIKVSIVAPTTRASAQMQKP
jgi:hypothetical protein